MKVSELEGPRLDYQVKRALRFEGRVGMTNQPTVAISYSTDWDAAAPIIKNHIAYRSGPGDGVYSAFLITKNENEDTHLQIGPTPLIAMMRCYVASVYGDEV
ncbi:hypothetical protein LMG22037_05613 [Paraburkholderia phenoliruptrix]|uniref:Uncharacterized protein n=1 Tax=Paraburkholderia phenoliruptrix TaxID=252970 RepID=A0A6J5C9L7_9BURK|nr:hypothetical protein LMG22037_05613 [Paraburkholderia phenoliruptrix]